MISPSIFQSLLLPHAIVTKAWSLLNRRLNPVSWIHFRSIYDKLCTFWNASDQSIANYLIDAKSIFHLLATTRFLIMNTNFVEYVIDGLGPEYQSFITSLHFRSSTTFDELYDLFLHEEIFKKKTLWYIYFSCWKGFYSILPPIIKLLQIF